MEDSKYHLGSKINRLKEVGKMVPEEYDKQHGNSRYWQK